MNKILDFLRKSAKATDEEVVKELGEEASEEKIAEARAEFEKEQKLEKAAEKVAEIASERAVDKVLEKLASVEPVLRKNLNGLKTEKKTIQLIKKKLGCHALDFEVAQSSIDSTAKWFRAYRKSFVERNPAILQKAIDEIKATQKTLNETTGAEGGYLVDIEFERAVLSVTEVYGVARSLFRVLPMSTNEKRLRGIITKPTFTATAEQANVSTGTKPVYSQPILKADKYMAIIIASSELMEDNSTDEEIFAQLARLLGEAWAKQEDNLAFQANTTNMKGVLVSTNAQITDVYLGDSSTSGKTSMEDATADDYLNLQQALSAANKKKGVYVIHSDQIAILAKLKDVTSGQYIYSKPADPNLPATLWRKPVIECDELPSLSDDGVSTKFGLFVNGEIAGIIGNKRSLTLRQLTEGIVPDAAAGTDVNLAKSDQEALRATVRMAFVVGLGEGIARLMTSAS